MANTDFYQLIHVNNVRNSTISSGTTADERTEPEDFLSCVEKLLAAYGYFRDRRDEMEEILVLKPHFVLVNSRKSASKASGEGLLLLVADQTTFFKSGDPIYLNSCWNKSWLSNYRQSTREWKSKRASAFLDIIKTYIAGEEDCNFANGLLSAICEDASNRKITLYSWLYNLKHAERTKENAEAYASRERVYGALPSSKKGQQRWIQNWIAAKNPFAVEMLNYDRCRESFENLKYKCDTITWDDEKWLRFIEVVLPMCIAKDISMGQEVPGISAYRVWDNDTTHEYNSFKERYKKLSELEAEFLKMSKLAASSTGMMIQAVDETDLNDKLPNEDDIIQVVIDYFASLGRPLRQGAKGEKYILIENLRRTFSNNPQLFPVALLVNMHHLKQWIEHLSYTPDATAIDFSFEPYMSKTTTKEEQRYQQLQFLDRLFKIMNTSPEVQSENLTQYFAYWGPAIADMREYQYWKEKLNGQYTAIPEIGFQFFFWECWKDCMPINFSDLEINFRPSVNNKKKKSAGSEATQEIHPVNWELFEKQLLRDADILVKKDDPALDAYLKFWVSNVYSKNRANKIVPPPKEKTDDAQPSNNSSYDMELERVSDFDFKLESYFEGQGDLEKYRPIVKELILRYANRQRAMNALLELFDANYNCKINPLAFSPSFFHKNDS